MRSPKRVLYALGLLVVLLTATSARPVQSQCDPPYGDCYSYCASGSQMCISASWNGYFCAPLQGGCYGTIYCDVCE